MQLFGEDQLPRPDGEPFEHHLKRWPVHPGQLWAVPSARGDFNHYLLCGDCTHRRDVGRLLERVGGEVDVVCADPPYSSGAFQESDKSASNSIGNKYRVGDLEMPVLARDNLTVTGYQTLITMAVAMVGARWAYVFTDWRMWEHTKGAVEAGGYPVRSKIVWDKLYMGMGVDWRARYEEVCYGRTGPGELGGQANLIRQARTGNEWHPTEKPVPLLRKLLAAQELEVAPVVYDPFAGSGSTLLAAELERRQFLGVEIAPKYVAAALERCRRFKLHPKLEE